MHQVCTVAAEIYVLCAACCVSTVFFFTAVVSFTEPAATMRILQYAIAVLAGSFSECHFHRVDFAIVMSVLQFAPFPSGRSFRNIFLNHDHELASMQ